GSLSGGLDPSNPIGTFGKGVGNITPFLGSYGGYFAILVLNAFILTTLDTATRIARYITTEFFGLKNIYISSAIVVICSLALLLGGQADNLWTVFGAANQLLAALSLFVITAWLFKTKRNYIVSLIPAIFMSIITLWALVYQFGKLNMVALIFAIALFILGVFVSLSSLMAIFKRA
ncbi:MAG: carbon starvation CstA 5TM domain-containing protein, partial [candidate division WOR-3 bacterium]